MRSLRLSVLLVLGAPPSVLAQPHAVAAVDRYDISISGEPIASVDVFYDQISPYGVWIDDPSFGRVFIPDAPHYVPYSNGHWQYTNIGFVWISSEPFAWATSHYGRWVYLSSYERWAWRPDTIWGPSWVEWREVDGYLGWAPLAPGFAIGIGYTAPTWSWHYCGASHILDVQLSRYYEPERRVIELHRQARPLDHYGYVGGARVNVGPTADTLRERHIDARATAIDPHAVGRWTREESRAAITRAEQRRGENDELNRRRVQSNAALRQPQVQPQVQPAPRQPQVQPTPRQPQVQPAPRQPQVQSAPRQPQVQPAPRQPQVQPAPRQPQVQPAPRQPQVQPAPRQPQVQPAPRQPQVQPVPVPKQPQVQPAPRQPQVQPAPKQPPQPAKRSSAQPDPGRKPQPR